MVIFKYSLKAHKIYSFCLLKMPGAGILPHVGDLHPPGTQAQMGPVAFGTGSEAAAHPASSGLWSTDYFAFTRFRT